MKEEIHQGENEEPVLEKGVLTPRKCVEEYIFIEHPFADSFFTAEELWQKFSEIPAEMNVTHGTFIRFLKELAEEGYLTYDAKTDRYCERPVSYPSPDLLKEKPTYEM